MWRVSGLALLAGFLFAHGSATQAQVAADGTTATEVTIGADGRVTIGIAPAGRNGISHNRYERFNVPSVGVDLDNRDAAARTVLNEVTGTGRSMIEGEVTVLGQKAHVIIANPNGIVIDGGRFVNTGRVALTTGKPSISEREIAPGIFQSNVAAMVSGGAITIAGGGLSGQMDALDLIAETVRVAGPVTISGADSGLSLRAGHSDTTFDSAILPGNTSAAWSTTTGRAGSPGGMLVEILTPGVLRANRIGIEVSGAGAGVRFAGEAFAGSRGFTLRADGEVVLDHASVSAGGGIMVEGARITDTGSTYDAEDALVAFSAKGDAPSSFAGTSIDAGALSVSAAGDLSFSLLGEDLFRADLTGSAAFTSGAALSFGPGRITAGDSLSFEAGGAAVFSGASLRATGHLVGTAASVTLDDMSGRPELVAEAGSLILAAAGDLKNTGGLIQGGQKFDGVATGSGVEAAGAVTLHSGGSIQNSAGRDHAILFAAGGDLVLDAGTDITNMQGRFLANGMIRISAGGDIRNLSFDPAAGTGSLAYSVSSRKRPFWAFWRSPRSSVRLSYDGLDIDPERLATITASEGVVMRAAGLVLNHGGEINANDGDVSITARKVETIGLVAGRMTLSLDCGRSCTSIIDGAATLVGGRINADGSIVAEAAEGFENTGGQVFATARIVIEADQISAVSRALPVLISRPGGLYNLWAGPTMRLLLRDHYGAFVTEAGDLVLTTRLPILIDGGQLLAGGETITPAGVDVRAEAGGKSLHSGGGAIGLFSDFPLIDR